MKILAGLVAVLTLASTSVLAHPGLIPHAHPHTAAPGVDVMIAVAAVLVTGLVVLMVSRRDR